MNLRHAVRRTRPHQIVRWRVLASAACLLSLTLGGVGAIGGGSTAGALPTQSLSAIKAYVATLENPSSIKYPMPTTAFKPGRHQIAVLVAGEQAGQTIEQVASIDQAAKDMGWPTPHLLNGNFSVSTESSLIEQVAAGGYGGLIMISVTPSDVSSAIQQLVAKKVPTVCITCATTLPKGLLGVNWKDTSVGVAQADWAIASSNGTGNIAVFDDAEFGASEAQYAGNVAQLTSNCSGCTVTDVSMTAAEATTPGSTFFSGFLSSHTGVQYAILPYDAAAQPFISAAQQLNYTGVEAIGLGPYAPYLAMIKAGSPAGAAATISVPQPFYTFASVDLLARAINKLPTWNASNIPFAIITKNNSQDFNATTGFLNPPFNYQKKFEALWKK
jgi:ABC-type sugar transport system substrate-binding protein